MQEKPKTIREQIESRLKEIGFWPCPQAVIESLVSQVNVRVSTIVQDTPKGWGTLGQMIAKADPARLPGQAPGGK